MQGSGRERLTRGEDQAKEEPLRNGRVALKSYQEWRFIVYVVPVFNTLAAIVAQAM